MMYLNRYKTLIFLLIFGWGVSSILTIGSFYYIRTKSSSEIIRSQRVAVAQYVANSISLATKLNNLNLIHANTQILKKIFPSIKINVIKNNKQVLSIPTDYLPIHCSVQQLNTPVLYNAKKIGNLNICYQYRSIIPDKSDVIFSFATGLLYFILFFILGRVIHQRNKRTTLILNDISKELNLDTSMSDVFDDYQDAIRKISNQNSKLQHMNVLQEVEEVASQVAHDIRSPVAALYMLTEDLIFLPEDKRLLMRSAVTRIQDIASDLLSKNKFSSKVDMVDRSRKETKTALLSNVINSLLGEKRTQYRSKSNILIESSLGVKSYGLFAKINIVELKRVLSNLINNAVEVFDNKDEARILISLRDKGDDSLLLTIEDNGKGIPADILKKLCSRGKTYGKQGGSGLGLYHAKTTIESWGGAFDIESEVGLGTKIKIVLVKVEPPESFVSQIFLGTNDSVVVIDDDSSIHQIWKNKIDTLKFSNENVSLTNFTGPKEYLEFKEKIKGDLFLVDYEFIGEKMNGLDLIKKFNWQDKSVLVTSRYEDQEILNECEKYKIKIIPKELAGFVPLLLNKKEKVRHMKQSTILLDDDPLVRLVWKLQAEKKNVDLSIFECPNSLFEKIDNYSKNSIFYIDSDLSDNQKGEAIAKKLFDRGFENLYLATGYESEKFKSLSYIKGIIGKTAPW